MENYCQSCGTAVLPTMLICPACGGQTFSQTKPLLSSPENTLDNSGSTTLSQNTVQDGHSSYLAAKHFPRLIAAIVDSVIVSLVGTIINVIATDFSYSQLGPSIGMSTLLGFFFTLAYFSFMHSGSKQATLGKIIMGLKLIKDSGEPVNLSLAFWRAALPSALFIGGSAIYVVVLAPFLIMTDGTGAAQDNLVIIAILAFFALLMIPHLLIFGNPEHKSLYDKICNTKVVQK